MPLFIHYLTYIHVNGASKVVLSRRSSILNDYPPLAVIGPKNLLITDEIYCYVNGILIIKKSIVAAKCLPFLLADILLSSF